MMRPGQHKYNALRLSWGTYVKRRPMDGGEDCSGGLRFSGVARLAGSPIYILNTPYMYLEAHDISSGRDPGSTRNIFMLALILLAMIPVLLAGDIAATSSRCDMLSDSLNAVAVSNDPASHLKVDFLETRLRRMNRGQGL